MTGNGSKALRRYNVRTDKGTWLAEIVISDDGFFATVSDYGNYAYAWTHAGEEFRRFLARLDSCYLLGKLCGKRDDYSPDETLKSVKAYILECRRVGTFDKEEARKEWELLAEHGDLDSRECFAMWYQDTTIGDAYEFAVYNYDAQARGFASTVWPAFAAVLRAELSAEQTAPVPS